MLVVTLSTSVPAMSSVTTASETGQMHSDEQSGKEDEEPVFLYPFHSLTPPRLPDGLFTQYKQALFQ